MPAQKGKDLLLKLDMDLNDTFRTLAGLRTRRLSLNTETVDVTHAESAGRWRELLAGAGAKRAGLSGAGLFVDDASHTAARMLFFDALIRPWQVIIPAFGMLTGPFQIVALEYSGAHDGEIAFDLALESAGALAFAELG